MAVNKNSKAYKEYLQYKKIRDKGLSHTATVKKLKTKTKKKIMRKKKK